MSGLNPDGYLVKLKDEVCAACSNDELLCTAAECCRLCYHMYSCDNQCYDFTNGHICKHIHRVHSLRLQERPSEATVGLEGEAASDIESDDDPLEFAESVRNNTTGIAS